jgi:hypothetical protein
MVNRIVRSLLAAGLGCVMCGCPWDTTSTDGVAGSESAAAGGGDAGSSDASASDAESVAKAIAEATALRFPPAPSVDTLCKLRPGRTNLAAAQGLFGKPQSESQDSMHASQSYRFRAPMEQAAGAGGGASVNDQQTVSMYLSFAWSDGSPSAASIFFGIGATPDDFRKGYLLKEMSITGMPYPACWPHEEE